MQHDLDSFCFDLLLRHPSCDARTITQELGVQPWFASTADPALGPEEHKSTVWMAHLQHGKRQEDFDRALAEIRSLLETKAPFLDKVVAESGEIELTLNERVDQSMGMVLCTEFAPDFLRALARHDVALQVQGWADDEACSHDAH